MIRERKGEDYLKPNGSKVSHQEVCKQACSTLSGFFCLGGVNDVAMIEELVDFDPVFDGFSYQGVPDIRIILYKGYPFMAMTRLSAKNSDGKVNLHQGAVGLGINIKTGKGIKAIQDGQLITEHPDTGKEFRDFQVPNWDKFLHLASRCYEISELGYLGADIVLDAKQGPLILELNARPGLAIQMANGIGMLTRFDKVEPQVAKNRNPQERVLFSQERLACEIVL